MSVQQQLRQVTHPLRLTRPAVRRLLDITSAHVESRRCIYVPAGHFVRD